MTRIVLSFIAAVFVCGCASEPRWDTGVFPNQVVYDAYAPSPVAAK